MSNQNYQALFAWTAITGIITLACGILSVLGGIFTELYLLMTPDIAGGCILLLVGLLLMTGFFEGRNSRNRWIKFGYTGFLLLLIFGGCTVLIVGANAISQVLAGEPYDPFMILTSGFIIPALLSLPAYPGIRRALYGLRGDT